MFNHAKLLGRIKERGFTQGIVAEKIGMTQGTFGKKIKNESRFSTDEIDSICELLDISPDEIGVYFFTK